MNTTDQPDYLIPLTEGLTLAVFNASTAKPEHTVFRIVDGNGNELSLNPLDIVLAREIVRLKQENREAWHVAAQNERNSK